MSDSIGKPDDVGGASVQSIVLLPCPFCGSDDVHVSYDDYDFARWVSCNQCECDGSLLIVQPGTKEAALAGVVRKWNTRNVCGHAVLFHWEKPGVISENGVWVVCHDGYMYGPSEHWQDVAIAVVDEWESDRNLVG